MPKSNLLKTIFFLFFIVSIFFNSYGQSGCGDCTGDQKQYKGEEDAPTAVNSGNNPTNDTYWDPSGVPGTNDIAVFNDGRSYEWIPNNSTTIKGLILENNSNLILNRFGSGITPSFVIQGTVSDPGCIIVRAGSTLELKYISNLSNVTICVEENGKIIFDARDEDRNDFLFNGVDINLEGPGAEIEFGEADINLGSGGVTISGYSGGEDGCTLNPDGSYTLPSPVPNISADPSKTNVEDFCNFLDAAGFSIQPVEYLYIKSQYQAKERVVQLNWATAKEWENSHFEIERSVNGIDHWERIGEVKGVGWSEMPVEYFFTDKLLPLRGGQVFYRLKQVDFNEEYAYSIVLSVRVPSLLITKGVWRVFPNPTTGEYFQIELLDEDLYRDERITAYLFSPVSGKKVLQSNDIESISSEVREILGNSGKGVFILELAWGDKIEHIKILRQ